MNKTFPPGVGRRPPCILPDRLRPNTQRNEIFGCLSSRGRSRSRAIRRRGDSIGLRNWTFIDGEMIQTLASVEMIR
jgi:hypothetical protein